MTRIQVHPLPGLNPDSLATYLAAVGIFRLLAEQKDACVRGFWRDEHFVLVTELDWDAIEQFFLQDYSPTPILAPWNMESGFYSLKPARAAGDEALDSADASQSSGAGEGEENGDADLADAEDGEGKEGDTEEAVGDSLLDRIGASAAPRFGSFRRAIEVALANIPGDLREAERISQRAHAEMRAQLADAGSTQTERDVEKLKAEIDALKANAKGTKKGSPAQEALAEGQVRFKQAKQHLKDQKVNLRGTLKAKEKDLKAPIEEAKKRFKDLQSSTKARLIADLRARWGDEGQQWVDAAVGLDETQKKGKKGFEFTSLFGSGGNDGRMELTRNLRRHLSAIFDIDTGQARDTAADQLRAVVSGLPTNLLLGKIEGKKVSVGQLFPGRAGGTNMGAGLSGGAAVNPWEFVLMLEGAVALVAGMTRRGDVGRARVSSPFWVEAASAGYGSASELEDSPRGEQWLPLWSHPLQYGELVELIREGRAQVGRRNTTKAGDLVRATARLGLARGIDSLQRFAYLERNGQSNLAVSAGRFQVASRSHQMLLEEIAPWIDRLTWYARRTKDNNVPGSLGAIARRTQEALFAVCRHDATPMEWRELLIALGSAELALLRSGKNPSRRPLPKLSCGWIAAVDDGSDRGRTALRLALALASQHRPPEKNDGTLKGSVRQHFVPLVDPDGDRPRFRLDDRGRAEPDPEDVCMGRDLVTDAIALVRRRSIWARTSGAAREKTPQLPLWPVASCEVTLEEIGSWVRGECSDKDVLGLVRPLLALNWSETADRGSGLPPWQAGEPDPLQVLFRLAHLPFDVPVQDADGKQEIAVTVRLDPEPLRRLAAGDLDGALRVAVRRLDASGLRPVFRRGVVTPALARRLAASLAFPISRTDAARAAQLVCKPYDTKEQLSSLA
jgi:CRISPR-associated protein Csx17